MLPCPGARGARPQPGCELADVFRRYGQAYRSAHRLPYAHHKVMNAIEACRTSALGGHRDWCAQCGWERCAYNSCRNRHCPKCGAMAKAQWLEERQAELLPVPYFHNVFTLPHQLNGLILCHEQNQRHVLKLLFQAASETLLTFGRNNLGGTLGITMVLHTWDQQLRAHFHVHALVTGGALSSDGQRWCAADPRFLFLVRALSKVFRAKFVDGLQQLYAAQQLCFPSPVAALASPTAFQSLCAQLRSQAWAVYLKAPFASPEKMLDHLGRYVQRPPIANSRLLSMDDDQDDDPNADLAGPKSVLDYLGRYIHRVAITNDRLVSCDDGQVRFRYRDRTTGVQVATLPAHEFIHRFLQHVLPKGFQRVRHYGLLARCRKQELLPRCRELLSVPPVTPTEKKSTAEWLMLIAGIDIQCCPQCGHQPLQRVELPRLWPALVNRRPPPVLPPQVEDTS